MTRYYELLTQELFPLGISKEQRTEAEPRLIDPGEVILETQPPKALLEFWVAMEVLRKDLAKRREEEVKRLAEHIATGIRDSVFKVDSAVDAEKLTAALIDMFEPDYRLVARMYVVNAMQNLFWWEVKTFLDDFKTPLGVRMTGDNTMVVVKRTNSEQEQD